MPSRKLHNLANKLLLGEELEWVNAVIDAPAKLYLKGHRKYFHSKEDAKLLALLGGGKAGKAALIHQFLDKNIPSIVQRNIKFFKLEYDNILSLLKSK